MKSEKVDTMALRHTLKVEAHGNSLVRLIQRQDLDIQVVLDKDQPSAIAGPVDAIHWKNLADTAELLRHTLERSGLHEPGQLLPRFFLVRREGKWSPAVEIVSSATSMSEGLLEKTTRLVQFALAQIRSPDRERQLPLDPGLDAQSMQAVEACVASALAMNGGRVIRAEMHVEVAGQEVANLRGRLKAKPDRSDFNAVPVEIHGRLTGFQKTREVLFFSRENEGELQINVGKLKVDLVEIARLADIEADVCLRLHRTIDRSGAYQYAYVTLLPRQDAGA